ncbi:hypothetical protein Cni_G15212 [Canna indica]|uniref:Bifunctional lysine-specific demethylase and histidyl-hydroxylase n=1 Tax=Canna indica TaxID=4628 RepID=A0AAQ3QEN7_9LILI|nr:hypothetical protein Cni_G15212 [Canna indica]
MDDALSHRKRRRPPPPPPLDVSSFDRTDFPLLLAASTSGEHQSPQARSILRRFLRARLALLTGKTQPSSSNCPPPSLESLLPRGLLSLFPLLLTSRWPSVAALGAEVIGAAALYSLEANEMLALDRGVIKGLILALGRKSRRVVKAACNAVMDLSTSPIGREQLRKTSTVERLLSLFCQAVKIHSISDVYKVLEKGSNGCSKQMPVEESSVILVLAAALILINSSTEDLLDRIPKELTKRCLPLLQEIWKKIRGLSLMRNHKRCQHFTKYDLATTIFKLSMNQTNPASCDLDKVRISIFGSEGSNFENFMMACWENLPFLLSGLPRNPEQETDIFVSLSHSFNPKSINDVLESILMGLVSCPPLTSDEVDINSFLNEVSSSLGSPLIYGQDIRVLKALQQTSESFKKCVKKEVHLFERNLGIVYIDGDSAQKCKDAFQNGFTIAVRGMEFRSAKIAAIAKGLADLFGQPSVGANLYLTPPGSQGLSCHYDDHCVFVWQLLGQKHWTISSSPASILPRLYEPLSSFPRIENEDEGLQMLLNEGDILYIPRGYLHEAHTKTETCESGNKLLSEISLHLTLAIEVEPPFEWEGFAHVALHCWYEKEKKLSDRTTNCEARRLKVLSVLILHVAIRLIADGNPIFRKACLVAAKICSSKIVEENHAEALRLNQKATFLKIIDAINCSSNFMEAFKKIAVIQEGNDDSLQWMRWLHHLPQYGDDSEIIDYLNPLRMQDELGELCGRANKQIKDEFFQNKSKFCRFVVYEDACEMFHLLLEKYRRTRKQYMNGMLALHSA